MNETRVSRKKIIVTGLILLAFILILTFILIWQNPALLPTSNQGLMKRVIEVRAEGEVLHYENQSFWNESAFSNILNSEKEFKSEQINSLNISLQKYGKVMLNPNVEIDEENKSTTLICDVDGAMYSKDSYEFHWLLADLPFDLYAFEQSENELVYKGEIDNVPTTIKLLFPFPINHCHEHVWSATTQ